MGRQPAVRSVPVWRTRRAPHTGHRPAAGSAARYVAVLRYGELRRRLTGPDRTAATVRRAGGGRPGRVGQRHLRVPRGRRPGHREPQPVAPVDAGGHRRPLRGGVRPVPGAGNGPVEHQLRGGRHGRDRHRSADLHRDRRGGFGALPRAPRRPAGHRRHLHPLPRRPLRRRQGGDHPGGRRCRPGTGAGTRGVRGARGLGERVRRDGDGTAGGLHVRSGAAARPTWSGRRRPGSDDVDRDGDADPADGRDHDDRSGGGRRRGTDGVPDDAEHRGASGDEVLPPGRQGAVHCGERDAQPAQPADPTRCAGARPARVVEVPDRDDRPVRRGRRDGVRLPPLADLGDERVVEFLITQRDMYAYFTTRRCGCSIRA